MKTLDYIFTVDTALSAGFPASIKGYAKACVGYYGKYGRYCGIYRICNSQSDIPEQKPEPNIGGGGDHPAPLSCRGDDAEGYVKGGSLLW